MATKVLPKINVDGINNLTFLFVGSNVTSQKDGFQLYSADFAISRFSNFADKNKILKNIQSFNLSRSRNSSPWRNIEIVTFKEFLVFEAQAMPFLKDLKSR